MSSGTKMLHRNLLLASTCRRGASRYYSYSMRATLRAQIEASSGKRVASKTGDTHLHPHIHTLSRGA